MLKGTAGGVITRSPKPLQVKGEKWQNVNPYGITRIHVCIRII